MGITQLFLQSWERWSQSIWILQKDLVHTQDSLLSNVLSWRVQESQNFGSQILCEVWSSNSSNSCNSKTCIILIQTLQFLSEQLMSEKDDISRRSKSQTTSQITNSLVSENWTTHNFQDVESSPIHIMSEHVQLLIPC